MSALQRKAVGTALSILQGLRGGEPAAARLLQGSRKKAA